MPFRTNKSYSAEDRSRYLKDQPNSGLTIAEYCRTHGLSISTFDNWKRKNRKQNASLFIDFPVHNPVLSEQLTITCGSFSLSVPHQLSTEYLATVLTAMNRAVQ